MDEQFHNVSAEPSKSASNSGDEHSSVLTRKLRIYGAGGAGTNRVSEFMQRQQPSANRAKIMPSILDTSRSNLRGAKIPEDCLYLVPDLDGSGKLRHENHGEISKTIRQMLNQIPPQEFNLVVFSASGGSGSVIGPLIIKELIERALPVVGVVIGSYESVISSENTIKTLQSLESIAQNTQTPVVISYHHNELNESRLVTDKSVDAFMGLFSTLVSGENLEIDYKDIENFINFTRVSGKPQLATIHAASDEDTLNKVTAPVSIASLYTSPDRHHAVTSADYVTVGYGDLSSYELDQLHFAITVNDIEKIVNDIRTKVRQIKDNQQSRIERDSLVDSIDEVKGRQSDDGLVL